MDAYIPKIIEIQGLVRDETALGCLPYQIEDIKASIIKATHVDTINIKEYDVDGNPIIGMFERWHKQTGVYSESETCVEVRYAKHLNNCWSRFAICKEMCHGFIDGDGTRITKESDLIRLATFLTMDDDSKVNMGQFEPFDTERIAYVAALEILAPLIDRKKLVEKRKTTPISDMQIAQEFSMPVDFVKQIFDPKYVRLMDDFFAING